MNITKLVLTIYIILVMSIVVIATTINENGITLSGNSTFTGRTNFIQNEAGADNVALNIASINNDESSVWLSGNETNKGTLKITHNYPNIDDSSASAISISLNGDVTNSQGIFLNINNSTGSPLKITNDSITLVDFQSDGSNIFTTNDNDCLLAQETDGTDVFRVSCNSNVIWVRKVIPIGTNTYELGDSTHIWNSLYVNNVNITNILRLSANTTSMLCNSDNAGSIYYDGNLNIHLGCNSTEWNSLY